MDGLSDVRMNHATRKKISRPWPDSFQRESADLGTGRGPWDLCCPNVVVLPEHACDNSLLTAAVSVLGAQV